MTTPSLLVLGGTGFVGRQVCEALHREGWCITVPTRRARHAQAVQHLTRLTVLQAHVHDASALSALVAGHDVVINLVAILHGTATSFEHNHVRLPGLIAQACRAQGVRRLIHISALGAEAHAPSLYQRSKARGEEVLKQAGLELSLLQPSVIFGKEDKFLNLFAQLQSITPIVPLAGANTRFQAVWVEDVANVIAHCVFHSNTAGKTYELCGPEVFTLQQLVQKSGQWAGVRQGKGRLVFGIPHALAWLQAFLMELAPGQPLMSRDNLASMQVDNVASGHALGLKDLGIQASAVSSIAPGYLGAKGSGTALNDYREKAGR